MEERLIKRRITGANANKQEKGSRLRLAGALGGGVGKPGQDWGQPGRTPDFIWEHQALTSQYFWVGKEC